MTGKNLPIIFATDDNYAPYCYVAIFSLIVHSNKEKTYDIYIMVTNVRKEYQHMLETLSSYYVKVKCINIADYIKDVHLEPSAYISIAAYYRLYIPVVFSMYEKVLYLDSDIVIKGDVSQLFDVSLNDKPIGAVSDIPCQYMIEHVKELGDLNVEEVFNSGCMLIDTVRFEEEKIREKCLRLLEEDYKRENRRLTLLDQDALNLVLRDNVSRIDLKWNYQVQYIDRPEKVLNHFRMYYLEAMKYACIYHYSGNIKPWDYPKSAKAEIFWDIAKETQHMVDIVDHILGTCQKKNSNVACFEKWRFPYESIAAGTRIVLYAAGKIGRAFHQQMKISGYAHVVLWVDQAWQSVGDEDIHPIEDIKNFEYDYVIIAVKRSDLAEEIEEKLKSMGVSKEKIIWNNYCNYYETE